MKSYSIFHLLLAGIALNTLNTAGIGLMIYLSDNEQLRSLTFWTLGSLSNATWESLVAITSIIIPSTFFLIKNSHKLNIILLGNQQAKYLGVNVKKVRMVIIINVCLATAVCIAISGIIGFIGLVVPHLIRLLISANNKIVLPCSCLMGACILLIADTISRTAFAPSELPVGIITSFIGAPFFIWLLVKQNKSYSI